jgi:hypothetical protein
MVQRVERNIYGDGSKNYTAHKGMHSVPNYVYLLGMVMNTDLVLSWNTLRCT